MVDAEVTADQVRKELLEKISRGIREHNNPGVLLTLAEAYAYVVHPETKKGTTGVVRG